MRHRLTLPSSTYEDLLCLLERASGDCGVGLSPEVLISYKTWIEGLQAYAEGEIKDANFGVNVPDELTNVIDAQAASARGIALSDDEAMISSDAGILKGFRDYFVYAVSLMPLGTSVYWRPLPDTQLHLVVTTGKAPKSYIKLI